MIHSTELGISYQAIPKVACTAIKHALAKQFGLTFGHNKLHREFATEIWTRVEPEGFTQTPTNLPKLYTFCFVRNPFDRLVSCFTSKIVKRQSGLPRSFERVQRFSDFVEAVIQISPQTTDAHLRPQVLLMRPCAYDFIGRFETLSDGWAIVKANSKIAVDLEKMNATEHGSYQEFYTPALREKVTHYYKADLDQLGYAWT